MNVYVYILCVVPVGLCDARFVVCIRRFDSSNLGVARPALAQRRYLACCFSARTAALFSLLSCAAPRRASSTVPAMASAGSTAPPGGALQPAYNAAGARRVALDGKPYTWDEFVKYYGNAARECWDKASPADEESESVSAGDARQLAVHAADGGAPQPGPAASSDASQLAVIASSQAQPLGCVCTYAQLAATRREPGFGGKMAWAKGKELRKECMGSNIFEKDLTFNWPELRKCLRAMPDGMQQLLAGNGIAHFKFRLLKGKRDANYRSQDSGERHVFEILRIDGTAYHLHYHKSGTCDTPVFVEADSGAPQPAVPAITFSASQPNIGRKEAAVAL